MTANKEANTQFVHCAMNIGVLHVSTPVRKIPKIIIGV